MENTIDFRIAWIKFMHIEFNPVRKKLWFVFIVAFLPKNSTEANVDIRYFVLINKS